MSKVSDENQDKDDQLDMFGFPLSEIRDRRGRKSFSKSKENQRLVIDLVASGMTQNKIATVLGCDEKTLRKHFSRQLHEGAMIVEAEATQVLIAKMRQGNISAAKVVREMAAAATGGAKPDKKMPEKRLGKKEQAKLDADKKPSSWNARLN